MAEKKITPLMEQYNQQKALHPDKILLFRMGDFYELFDEDAITAAPILGIALTVRNRKAEDATKMCGVPHHSIAGPINKLLQAGYKVAICDQLEDPKQAKGIVKRGVTRILSPGMVYDPDEIESVKTNYLASFDDESIAFFEASTSSLFYFIDPSAEGRESLLAALQPAELVLSSSLKQNYLAQKKSVGGPFISSYEPKEEEIEKIEKKIFKQNKYPSSVLRLLAYAVSMQGEDLLQTIHSIEERVLKRYLRLNPSTIKHLELIETYQGKKQGSLLHTIDRTKTSVGARLLRQWLLFPLMDEELIKNRQEQIAFWLDNYGPSTKSPGIKAIREHLSRIGDIERRIGKICHPNANPRDLVSLALSLKEGLALCAITSFYSYSEAGVRASDELVRVILSAIEEEAPLTFNKEYFVKKGFRTDLDEWIDLTSNGEAKILQMEEEERATTGIPSLKIRYNNVFGYYIEVTNTHKDKVPSHYLRKQTLTNAERYTTDALQDLERKILSAKTKRFELENDVFRQLKEKVLNLAAPVLDLARQWAELDVMTSLAYVAKEKSFVRPQINSENRIVLKGSRHPVVESLIKENFVANDIEMKRGEVVLLTGPNMAGKSTLMRQVACQQVLLQMGSFVPAKEANLPIIDTIFTRIGASDSMSEGLSTFMVEMKETAEIFESLTDRSLVIMDEIGRGTSTFDGMSLAQAILEDLLHNNSCYSLFATHYHELTRIENPKLRNAHMSIAEVKGNLKFLYQLKEGAANRSYGIHVAKLAGLPSRITEQAQKILKSLETENKKASFEQMDLFSLQNKEDEDLMKMPDWVDSLSEVEVNSMTPIQALNFLADLKEKSQLAEKN